MLALVISTTSFLPTHGTSAGQPCFSPSRSSCAVVACADKLRAKVSAPRKVRGMRPVRKQGKAAPQRELQRLYITGGECRGRKLRTPDVFLRPMMSRVREALFSMLYPSGVVRNSAAALDLFAGSGAVGLEALSRGMGAATFVDFSPKCTQTIRDNLESLGLAGRGRVVQASVLDILRRPESFGLTEPFDLVTMTPPYEEVVYAELMEALAISPLLTEDTMLVIEYPIELGVLPPAFADSRFVGIRNRRYGRTVLAIYVRSPSGRLDLTPRSEEFVTV